ncbi:hypothetical protein [Lentzea kentuckyensis]|uniref:hypothetical protein n=1 Tax=Lentzea kentuckyensis TaxID=360086 RepID=UPI000A395E4A|nr:hypothetical protein [Lentzea kentuckyensis]
MTIDLPPRRALPPDVKERMRPDFTKTRTRRNHTPLAVAAGVTLLVAGGITITQSATHDLAPARDRVVAPSSRDLARCRTALNDQNWSSAEMVVFGLRKVLAGTDGRFCELTASRASVAPQGFEPTRLDAGTITYRSSNVIAGVPPLGTRAVKARETVSGKPLHSSSGVVTPDFFIVHVSAAMRTNEIVFDEQVFPVQRFTSWSANGVTDSFESDDSDPWASVNVLARCIDNAFNNNKTVDELRGWEPLLESGLEQHRGMLLAHRGHREWATCAFTETRSDSLSLIRTTSGKPDSALVVGGHQSGSEFIMAGRTTSAAKTVEVSGTGVFPMTTNVADGHFIATFSLPIGNDRMLSPADMRLVARNAEGEIVYEGGIS